MGTSEQQIVGRFQFDDAGQRQSRRHPRAATARRGDNNVVMVPWFLAVVVVTAALWSLGF